MIDCVTFCLLNRELFDGDRVDELTKQIDRLEKTWSDKPCIHEENYRSDCVDFYRKYGYHRPGSSDFLTSFELDEIKDGIKSKKYNRL